jgi:signal transduction histidine kinase
MKIFGEELGNVGRWYIAVPPLLLMGFLVGLFLLATAGQTRLEASNERVRNCQLREQALSEYLALISTAETSQRGYIITGEESFLAPDAAAVAAIEPALERVHQAYATAARAEDHTPELRALSREKLTELQATLDAFKARAARPFDAQRIDVGKRMMDRLLALAVVMRASENRELSAATASLRADLVWSRWFTAAGAALNIGLVLLAMRLVYADMQRRARVATALQDQKLELERQVSERTQELTDLSTHLQEVSEEEKSALSRELHDELGGLLVAARMDLSWLQQRLPTSDPAIEQRFKRIHESLSAGVDLKRRVVEELRPTLLDNMGLFAALRWQFKETCRRSGLTCKEELPPEEPRFDPDAAIGIFRVAQEAMTNILKHAKAKSATMSVQISGETLVLRLVDDGLGIPAHRLKKAASHGLASMRHRITALGGHLSVVGNEHGGTTVTAVVPLPRVVLVKSA